MNRKIVWLLLDYRHENEEQLHGIASYMKNATVIEKHISFSGHSFIPQFLQHWFKPLLTENTKKSLLNQTPPDVILSSGKKTARVSWWLKEKYPNAYRVHFLRPGMPLNCFDRLALPLHDRMIHDKRVMPYYGEMHCLTEKEIQNAGKLWEKKFKKLKSPRICIFVGG
ncbi:MAG: mitochondrial fission ELM1 family protein, partial [Alphaproteobacteria bacterium]|nr:mitochondrial fission ELM1 family protein [Alphaproteobacteria bacterium]